MSSRNKVSHSLLVGASSVEFTYLRQTLSSTLLPLCIRVLAGNKVKLTMAINDEETAKKMLSLLDNWFEQIEVKEIEYQKNEKNHTDTHAKTD